MATMAEMEVLAKEYAEAREELAARVRILREEQEKAKARRIAGIKSALGDANEKRAALRAAIERSPDLFEKPRTRMFHGIKIGLQKGKGRLLFEDAGQVVALIKRHREPEEWPHLIKTREEPAKSALLALPASDLRKLGCTLEETGDEVVIRSADDAIDRLVDALLADGDDEAAAAEAAS